MSVKIIGGEFAGRKIETPDTLEVRPLGARVKRTLFDLLGETVAGARVADFFAGVGSFSFEALSRGAAEATLVEYSRILADYIYKNARRLSLSDVIRVYETDVLEYLKDVKPSRPYDLVFVDPPYRSGLVAEAIDLTARWPGVDADSVIITRVFKKEVVTPDTCFDTIAEKIVGDDKLTFYRISVNR
jgi:16S rRNA (guanine966-N2)-methyltransferase